MCYFLTVGVSSEHADRLRGAFGRRLRVERSVNRSILAALPADYVTGVVTRGMCSCDLYASPRGESAAGKPKQRPAGRRGSDRPPVRGIRTDVVERLGALCEQVGTVAIVVHWYSGEIDSESLSLTRGHPCPCSELPSRAASLPEDEILLVERAPGHQ